MLVVVFNRWSRGRKAREGTGGGLPAYKASAAAASRVLGNCSQRSSSTRTKAGQQQPRERLQGSAPKLPQAPKGTVTVALAGKRLGTHVRNLSRRGTKPARCGARWQP